MAKVGRFVTDPRAGAYCQVTLDTGEKIVVSAYPSRDGAKNVATGGHRLDGRLHGRSERGPITEAEALVAALVVSPRLRAGRAEIGSFTGARLAG